MTQFLRDQVNDSEEVDTPLMLDGTYLSRNFATLGPLYWQPPYVSFILLNGGCYKKTVLRKIPLDPAWAYSYNIFYKGIIITSTNKKRERPVLGDVIPFIKDSWERARQEIGWPSASLKIMKKNKKEISAGSLNLFMSGRYNKEKEKWRQAVSVQRKQKINKKLWH